VGLEAVVMKCLAKRPENRYQSMDEVIVDIDRLVAGTAPQATRERGNFAAPAAYYDETLPSAAGPRRSRMVVTIIVAVLALVAVAGAVLKLRSPDVTASPEAPAHPEQRAPESVTVVPPTATPVVGLRQVMIATEPLDAQIWKDGKNLGQGPLSVEVPEGKNVELQIVHEGYKNARVVLDGSEGPQSIKLEKAAAPVRPGKPQKPQPTAAPKPTATKKRPTLGGGEIIDPWSK
jgi:serine/threonine-protein kinase